MPIKEVLAFHQKEITRTVAKEGFTFFLKLRSNLSKYRTHVSQLIVAQAQEEKGMLDVFFCLRSPLIQGMNVIQSNRLHPTLSVTPRKVYCEREKPRVPDLKVYRTLCVGNSHSLEN